MKLYVFAIRDRSLDGFMVPQFMASPGVAVRAFADILNGKEESPIRSHPDDFDLYQLGEFDPETGLFSTGVPKQLALGRDLVISR